ncbi:MAG TPA: DUF6184 family natural product biosynthesis lipoprotein [Candidatus Nanopelagicales bacterium]|nr:DUF6184 family natural product biosynthesis lipoprotein [Candidatus Nanopelagicales bacterium]
MKMSRIGLVTVALAGIGVVATGWRERGEEAYGTERGRQEQIAPGVPPGAPPAQPQYGQQQQQPAQQGQVGLQPALQIAQARCAVAQRCNQVGAGQKYLSEDACISQVRADWREDFNAFECPAGYNVKELNECLEEIRSEECNDPIERLGSFAACRASDICNQM